MAENHSEIKQPSEIKNSETNTSPKNENPTGTITIPDIDNPPEIKKLPDIRIED